MRKTKISSYRIECVNDDNRENRKNPRSKAKKTTMIIAKKNSSSESKNPTRIIVKMKKILVQTPIILISPAGKQRKFL